MRRRDASDGRAFNLYVLPPCRLSYLPLGKASSTCNIGRITGANECRSRVGCHVRGIEDMVVVGVAYKYRIRAGERPLNSL